MGIFSTRNSDGASSAAEPFTGRYGKDDKRIRAGLDREVERHGMDSRAEFFTAGRRSPNDFPPDKAGRN